MPRLAVVLPALGGLQTVGGVLRRWEAQARGDELELVVLVRGRGDAGTHAPWLRTVDCDGLLLHEARARLGSAGDRVTVVGNLIEMSDSIVSDWLDNGLISGAEQPLVVSVRIDRRQVHQPQAVAR